MTDSLLSSNIAAPSARVCVLGFYLVLVLVLCWFDCFKLPPVPPHYSPALIQSSLLICSLALHCRSIHVMSPWFPVSVCNCNIFQLPVRLSASSLSFVSLLYFLSIVTILPWENLLFSCNKTTYNHHPCNYSCIWVLLCFHIESWQQKELMPVLLKQLQFLTPWKLGQVWSSWILCKSSLRLFMSTRKSVRELFKTTSGDYR